MDNSGRGPQLTKCSGTSRNKLTLRPCITTFLFLFPRRYCRLRTNICHESGSMSRRKRLLTTIVWTVGKHKLYSYMELSVHGQTLQWMTVICAPHKSLLCNKNTNRSICGYIVDLIRVCYGDNNEKNCNAHHSLFVGKATQHYVCTNWLLFHIICQNIIIIRWNIII